MTMRLGIRELQFKLETQLEEAITADPEWLEGANWGKPRPGHPEGKVIFHIRDVFDNIDYFFDSKAYDRSDLRLIALIHDTFKYQTTHLESSSTKPSHGYFARKFAERYISEANILQVIELHDEAYKAWRLMFRHTDPEAAEKQARELIIQLGQNLDLFLRFYLCDNQTGDKSTTHYEWFKELAKK